ncbi:MAG: tetratricopeptide repeat protein, partial [Gammaproteobacteria bacterium]|nr:tetratricopeptide repeat protein [Gammaproteobacteria bacterium]
MADPVIDIRIALEQALSHHRAGRMKEAEQAYRRILAVKPDHVEASHWLGVLAHQVGQHEAAVQLIAHATLKDPGNALYLNNLGLALQGAGRLGAARVAYEQAIAIDPNQADTHNSRGLVLQAQGEIGEALASFRQAIALDPQFAEAHNNLGNALVALGEITEAVAAYRRAIEIKPDFGGAYSNLLLCLQYDAGTDAAASAAAHRDWNARFAAKLTDQAPPHDNDGDPDRRLRIGYVSADFCRHPVASFIEPLLASHDREAFEVFCYSNVATPDDVTERLRHFADTWRPIRELDRQQLTDLIREDGIDILVDLAGHTAGNRLLAFARKPAPVQVTYLGYPATTGLDAIDYRLTDDFTDPPGTDPPGTDALYSETLVRLPGGSLCFQPPYAGPSVSPLADLD